MKSPDVTLLIQVVNFLIVYFVLRRYIFIPASKILEDQEFKDYELQQFIKESLIKKDNATHQMNLRLLEMKQQLKELIPVKYQESLNNYNGQQQDVNAQILLSQEYRQKIKKLISDSLSEVKL